MSEYFLSSAIKIYPASQRDSSSFAESKLSTEENVTNSLKSAVETNRLLTDDSFVASGTASSITLTAGSAIIHGYNISSSASQSFSLSGVSTNYVIGLELKSTSVDNFERIVSFDTAFDNSSTCYGVKLVARSEGTVQSPGLAYAQEIYDAQTACTYYRLPIAKWNGSSWDNLYTSSISSSNTLVTRRLYALVTSIDNMLYDGRLATSYTNSNSQQPQTLRNFLENNIGIDDGEIV